jgi:penicillin-binding protein 1C
MRRAVVFLTVFALVTLGGVSAIDRWVESTDLPVTLAETSVEMRDRAGILLRAYPVSDGVMRLRVTPDQVDPDFVDMLIRYEDKRFRSHPGVDLLALLRAAGQAMWHGRVVSGGSTLTMQVARLLEDGSTGRWSGKMRQIRLALALERRLSKDQILGLYLTHAPYGGNLEGLRAASIAWFAKEPRRLTPAQAALLVALPQSPETRRPDREPKRAMQSRNAVLTRLEAWGDLNADDAKIARQVPVPVNMRSFPQLAPHLADGLHQQDPAASRFDLTLDADLQGRLQTLAGRAAAAAGHRLSAAVLVADHQSGQILASVGSAGYEDSGRSGFVDMSQAIRSPGSTLKPLVYALAFDQGLVHPETLIHDGPVDFNGYAPQNFDGQFRGDVRIRDALQQSLNIPVVKLTEAMGPARVMDGLRRSGTAPRLPGGSPGLAIALGGMGMTLQDLVQLYAVLAQGGQGNLLHARSANGGALTERAVSPEAAWQVGNVLRGLTPPSGAPTGKLAFKTGTSYGHRDAWAVGYDGQHVVGVWMGRADGTPVPGAFGGDLAAPVLFETFGRIKPEFAPLPAPPPATLIVSSADLPLPLRRFRPRNAVFAGSADAPKLLFPPTGAELATHGGPLTVKLRGGVAPFVLLANGTPIRSKEHLREFNIPNPGLGFSTLVVVDGQGRSDRAQIRVRN